MRHVVVMTMTGSLGLTFMFLVDFVTLFYVSLLGDEGLTSAIGYAWTIQFFTVSLGIGFAIAATALVSRSLGARDREAARGYASSALTTTVALMIVCALAVLVWRRELLALAGARGEALEVAARFLAITLPSLPLVAIGMTGSSILRAEGDARRSMLVTMAAGLAAVALDPLLIFGLDLGVDGAATAMSLSRGLSALLALHFIVRVHDLAAPFSLARTARDMAPVLVVAAPATLTQLSTPFGNFLLTESMSQYGDSAVAGWAVVSRMTVLAFGGIFALSGAIGGIIGQNYGARRMDRVRRAFRDALIFCCVYVFAVWGLLALGANLIAGLFSLSAQGAEVVRVFGHVGAGGFVFAGILFVSNSAFNNLGRPVYSTLFNWSRDALAIPVALGLFAAPFLAPGVIYAQAAAGAGVGLAAALFAWRFVNGREAPPDHADWGSAPSIGSARAATALPIGRASGTTGANGGGIAGDAPDAPLDESPDAPPGRPPEHPPGAD